MKELVAGTHTNATATYKRDLQVLESKGHFDKNKSAEIAQECNVAASYWEYAKEFVDKQAEAQHSRPQYHNNQSAQNGV